MPSKLIQAFPYQVNHVPEAFHSWLASRETVLNRPEQVELGVLEMASGEVKDIMTCELVENVDPALGLPGNSYMAFDPIQVVSNISVSAQPIVVGGQTYKLRLVMAPETRYENTEENAELLLPTKIRVNLGNAIVEPSVDVSATETTVLEYEVTAESIATLQIITRVTNSQMKLGNYNRHFRLLEVRLTPVGTAQE